MTSSLGYMELCRLCLVKDKVTVPIFGDTNDVRQIFLKITACLPVKVSRDDNLPKKICDTCLYKIDLLYQFWNTTINAEKQLIQWLNEIGVDAKNVDASLQMLPQSHAHPHAMQEEIMMKEERIESETKDGATGFSNMYTEYPYQNPENNFDTSSVVEETTTAKRKTRGRPAGKKKAKVVIPESEDEDSIGSDRLGNDDTNDSDSDGGKIAKQEADSDEDYVDNPESLEPTTFVDVPSAADAEQPGPSGLSKPATITAGTSDQGKKTSLACSECGKVFRSPTSFKLHVQAHDPFFVKPANKLQCDVCMKVLYTIVDFRTHKVNKCIDAFIYTCEVCEKKFKYTYNLNVHKRRHTTNYSVKCKYCGKGFFTNAEYCNHIRVVHTKERVNCVHCSKTFATHTNYERHLKLHDPNIHLIEYTCPECQKLFHNRDAWRVHVARHYNNSFVCYVCGKVLTTSASLRDHTRVHTGDKPFPCPTCGKTFRTKNLRRIHQPVHMSEKPFICSECGKSFTQQSSLKVHRRIHTDERPYPCHICLKRFYTKTLMKTHLKTHGLSMADI